MPQVMKLHIDEIRRIVANADEYIASHSEPEDRGNFGDVFVYFMSGKPTGKEEVKEIDRFCYCEDDLLPQEPCRFMCKNHNKVNTHIYECDAEEHQGHMADIDAMIG